MKLPLACALALALAVCLMPATSFAQPPSIGGCNVFPADDVWNTPIDTLSVDASSASYVSTIGAGLGLKADFGAGLWNGGPIGIPFVSVPGSQTKYPATFTYADESDPGPYAVPLNAPIEGGSQSTGDRHAISIDTTNCILYELYAAYPQTASWTAGSGAIFDLNSYALRPATWTSADAAGLPIYPGLVRYDEVLTGEITHAIRFTVPQTRNTFIWPARHEASSLSGGQYPPMGQRFRLRADFDISGYSTTNQVILRALKKYGMMLADNGSAWYMSGVPDGRWNNSDLNLLKNVLGVSLEAVDESSLMLDPNSGQARQSGSGGTTVSVSPTAASVPVTTTKQFTATVTPPGSVTWSVNGTAGGNPTVGTISASGLYAAPAGVPTPATVTVAAQSGSTTGTATVTVTAPVTVAISPTNVSLRTGRTQQFTATVANATNTGVVWKVNGVTGGNATVGTVSSVGLYRAPNSVPATGAVSVSATSVESPSASASTTVTIRRH